MRERLLTLALALAAFAAFYVLMAPKPDMPSEQVTRPLSTEAGPNGYLALERWLTSANVAPVSLRERYSELARLAGVPPTGNLLLSTAPHVYPPRPSELPALREWIEAGNTLLIVAGLSDTPEWSMGQGQGGFSFLDDLRTITGLRFQDMSVAEAELEDEEGEEEDEEASTISRAQDAADAMARLLEPQRSELVPNGSHPLLAGVDSVLAISEYPSATWRAFGDDGLVLELATERTSAAPALWLTRHGNGHIIVSAYGSIFTNKLLGEHDNAQLLANIVQRSLTPEGRVIIDDAHQGLVAFYDPDKFFGDARLHRSIWWLVGLWLVFVLGSRRLRTHASSWQPLDVTTFVRATGGFMARVLRPATAAQRLFANFFNEVRERLGMPADGSPVWDWLGGRANLAADDLERLRQLHLRAVQRKRVDLIELHNLLVRTRTLLH